LVRDSGGSEKITRSLDGVKTLSRKSLDSDLLGSVKSNLLPTSSNITSLSAEEPSLGNFQRRTQKEESFAITSLTTALNEPEEPGTVERTCKTVSEVLACWSARSAFSQDILMFLLLVKTYGLEAAILDAAEVGLDLSPQLEASIAEYCKREKVSFL
jgi:hypothetical protein